MPANNFSPPFPPPVTPGAQAVPRGTPLGSPPRYPLGPVTPLGTSQVTPGVNPAPRVLHRDTQVPRYPWGTPGVPNREYPEGYTPETQPGGYHWGFPGGPPA